MLTVLGLLIDVVTHLDGRFCLSLPFSCVLFIFPIVFFPTFFFSEPFSSRWLVGGSPDVFSVLAIVYLEWARSLPCQGSGLLVNERLNFCFAFLFIFFLGLRHGVSFARRAIFFFFLVSCWARPWISVCGFPQ